ncbi:MAG TPA: NAD-dependent epimerase/dehydratase family protein [Egibacteraceae bacterium]|nr:NAD-dependent epimerase/dehydratase family protein [Egibacteraceae bacterium]
MLVTGGAGFIGSNLVDRLLEDGHEVTVVDDLSTGKLANLQRARRDPDLPLHFQRLDITSTALERAVDKARPEVVLHLAAQIDVRRSVADPVHDALVNVIGTVQLLEACRRHDVRKFVLTTSGGCIYGEPVAADLPIGEHYPGHPHSPYGASKRGVEEYLHTYEALYGLRWTSLALANVFGPRQDPGGEAGVVSIFGGRMLAGQPVTIYGDGEQTRDFVYVDDVVHAFTLAMDGGDGLRFNIGTGQPTSVNTLYAELADLAGYADAAEHAPERSGELRHIALDSRLAATELGWKPWTTLREGLGATLDWLRG